MSKYQNNTHLRTKIRLRADAIVALDKPKVYVLDAFYGYGLVWQGVQKRLPDIEIATLGIEKAKYRASHVIMGDNRKEMKGLNLQDFDLIDLDAYGAPWEQLAICAKTAVNVPVAVTYIAVDLGPAPHGVLKAVGIPDQWCDQKKVPNALFNRWRWEFWEEYCARLGYTTSVSELHLDKSAVKRYEILSSN